MKQKNWGRVLVSKRQREREWAITLLTRCKEGNLDRGTPEFLKASRLLGPIVTSRIVDNSLVTSKSKGRRSNPGDAMFRRVPGSFENGRR